MVSTFDSPVIKMTTGLMFLDVNLAGATILTYSVIRFGHPLSLSRSHLDLFLLPLLLPFIYYIGELYKTDHRWFSPPGLARAGIASAAAVLPFGLVHYLFSKSWELLSFFPVMAVALAVEAVAVRGLVKSRLAEIGNQRNVLIVGGGWEGRLVIDTILREPRLRMKIVGMIDDNQQKKSLAYKGVPVLGNRYFLRDEAETLGVNTVIVAIAFARNADLIRILLDLKMKGVRILDMPRFYESVTGQIPIKQIEDLWFLYSGGFHILHRPGMRKIKRLMDLALSLTGIILSLPLIGVLSILVKLDSPGPVFFRQERVGQWEKPFRIIKFRTMRADAEAATGPVWSTPGDFRVTRLGRALRATRLDEIPQFFNVLRGDMSFIGPRPERPYFVEKLKKDIPYYPFRFAVKPGLTGWAQVNYQYGASTEDAMEKLKYELYYLKNYSPWLDLIIIIKTLQTVLFARGT